MQRPWWKSHSTSYSFTHIRDELMCIRFAQHHNWIFISKGLHSVSVIVRIIFFTHGWQERTIKFYQTWVLYKIYNHLQKIINKNNTQNAWWPLQYKDMYSKYNTTNHSSCEQSSYFCSREITHIVQIPHLKCVFSLFPMKKGMMNSSSFSSSTSKSVGAVADLCCRR